MKCLEVRIIVDDSVDNTVLEQLGEQLQEEMPCEFECNGIDVEDVQFTVKEEKDAPSSK